MYFLSSGIIFRSSFDFVGFAGAIAAATKASAGRGRRFLYGRAGEKTGHAGLRNMIV